MDLKTPLEFQHASFRGQIGIARADITPPVGVYSRNWGAARHDVAASIHRPLNLTAMTLAASDHEQPLVFLDADLGWWKTPESFRTFQARLLKALGLNPENLIFALSHTHSGPPLMEVNASLPGSELLRVWMENLLESTIRVAQAAQETAFHGILDWHLGRCHLATVRDLPDPDSARDRFVCGYNPHGDPDDTLLVGRVTDTSGQTRATLVNYACHPTTLAWDNTAISPDYVGAMRETIQAATGAPALFLLGVCGELAPRYQYVGDPEIADRHGRELGYAALATLQGMEPAGSRLSYSGVVESGAPLAVWKHSSRALSSKLLAKQVLVELPLKDWPSAHELEQQRALCSDRALEERLIRKRDIRRFLGDGAIYRLPIFTWRIGDAVLIGCCGEPYSILQRELRSRFPGKTILCLNLINGSIGYLPPAELYDKEIYPVWQTPFDKGCLEKTLEAMTAAVRDVLTE